MHKYYQHKHKANPRLPLYKHKVNRSNRLYWGSQTFGVMEPMKRLTIIYGAPQ